MPNVKAYAARDAQSPLAPFSINRRDPRDFDVLIDIHYCGVCHSDLHQAADEWGGSIFPMVPGHEIVGKVSGIGSKVSRFKVGDTVGVGCFVDSCKTCSSCKAGLESYCEEGPTATYNSLERDGETPTYGGYSNSIVVQETFVLKVSDGLDLAKVAPLLCAGITTYSPLRHWKVSAGQKVGIVGLGGLGHMGIKFANAFGADVTCFTTSPAKRDDALKLGAHHVVVSSEVDEMEKQANSFDFILDSVSGQHDLNAYLALLKLDGTLCVLGVPPQPSPVHHFSLIGKRRNVAGSLVGGIAETQEMLDFCAQKNITSDVEMIGIEQINEAYRRMLKSDVKYRFVIDMKTL